MALSIRAIVRNVGLEQVIARLTFNLTVYRQNLTRYARETRNAS